MFDAVVVTLCVESVANRAALVVRLKEHAPVHCSLSSSISSRDVDKEKQGAGTAKRVSATDTKGKGVAAADGQSSKRNKTH